MLEDLCLFCKLVDSLLSKLKANQSLLNDTDSFINFNIYFAHHNMILQLFEGVVILCLRSTFFFFFTYFIFIL